MPGVNAEQIEQAKQWDLLSYLQQHEPGELKKTGPHEFCTVTHDSLKISNGKWNWTTRGFGGKTALDYLPNIDAQFHGVPQRRRRIILVCDFTGQCAGNLLFKPRGLPGYSAPSICEGQSSLPEPLLSALMAQSSALTADRTLYHPLQQAARA